MARNSSQPRCAGLDHAGRVPGRRAEHQLVQVRLPTADGDEDDQRRAQPLGGSKARVRLQRVHVIADALPALGGDRGQQALLVGEVPVGRTPADACTCAHLAERDCAGTAAVEQLGGAVEQGAARGGGGLDGGSSSTHL